MEFFEKAHIAKNNEMKSKKTTENVKKQLKQMLHGYKVSDNKLIQNFADSKDDFDDSASVSGFSDLNLTNSSHEDTHSNIPLNEESITDVSENLSSNVLSDNTHTDDSSKISRFENNYSDHDNEDSMSGSSENLESLSGDMSENEDVSSLGDSEISIVSGMLDSSPESDKSEVFDADGSLAAKIFKKLDLNNSKNNKTKKRKHVETESTGSSTKKGPKCNRIEKKVKSVVKKDDYKNKIELKEISDFEEETDSSISNESVENIDDNNSNPTSPEFVSITATDMPGQSLAEVVGDYRHATIRKLPKDNQNTIFQTSNSGIFIEESISEDMPILTVGIETCAKKTKASDTVQEIEDEASSIIPEVDDVATAEEIEEVLSNPDTTAQINETLHNLDNSLQSDIISDREPSIEEDRNNFNAESQFKLYYGHNCCIIILKHPSELYIQGKICVKCLGGTVEVHGYVLKPQSCEIYAPYYNYAQCIKTVENANLYYGLFGRLTAAGLSVADAEDIVTTSGEQDGIILLEQLNKKSMDFVDNNFKMTNLFAKPLKNIDPYFIKASDMLNCSLFSICPWQHFVVNPSWKEANEHAQKNVSRGIVCGGKGSGKTTYLRYQVNKLLAKGRVLVVDLDPGQSEFTVAGSISATIVDTPLIGPSYTHLKNPVMSFNLGMINTMDNPKRYLSAVRGLLELCFRNKSLTEMPWVINTMGMTNLLGLKFMIYIIILSNPTYLLQFESKNNKRRFDSYFRAITVKLLYLDYQNDHLLKDMPHPTYLNYAFVLANEIEKTTKNKLILKPKDERYLSLLAYFSQLINKQHSSILSIVPYRVSLQSLYIATNVYVKADSILKVINGKVVALCQYAPPSDGIDVKVFTLSDKMLRYYGHGLIRGVDWEEGILYIVTPVPKDVLSRVNALLYADWVPELVGYETELPKGTVVPYRTMTQDQHKQLMSTPHRRFNPLQLLKMARSS